MSELTINQIIKLIIGSLVVVAVVVGLYFAFKRNVFDFFNGIDNQTGIKIFLYLFN